MKPIPGSDIDEIIKRLLGVLPGAKITQLQVTHPADDDGLWFIKVPGVQGDVQIESSSADCPFLIESTFNNESRTGNTIEEVVSIVRQLFPQGGQNAD